MKKIFLLIITLFFLVGCCSTKQNPLKAYEGKNSEEIFYQGEHNIAKKKYEKATMDLAALDVLYPFGPYAQQGQLDIIYAYYMNNDLISGTAAADRYIRLY